MNEAIYMPETDLAWAAYMVCVAIAHDRKKYWHECPDYSRMEAQELGISTECLRAMRRL